MAAAFFSRPSLVAILLPPLVFILTMFGPGLLNVSPAPYFSLAIALGYLERLGPWSRAHLFPNLYLWICVTLGTGVAYAGMLQDDDWQASKTAPCFAIGALVSFVYLIPLWIHLAYQRRFVYPSFSTGSDVSVGSSRSSSGGSFVGASTTALKFENGLRAVLGTLVAPTVWVALFTIAYAVSPIGSYGSIAYTQHDLEPMVQWSSVAGIGGIEFYVVWAAVILHRSWMRYMLQTNAYETGASNGSSADGTVVAPKWRRRRVGIRLLLSPTPIFLMVSMFIYFFGSMRAWNATGTFYQKPLRDTILDSVKASCIIGNTGDNDLVSYLNQTDTLAAQGSKIVMWSELAVKVQTPSDKEVLFSLARNRTVQYGIYLGITYSEPIQERPERKRNMFTVFDPQGRILLDYQKAHPVTMVEVDTVAGPNVLPTADTPDIGRIGGAICFDLDFPNFIAQAGKKKVDLLLQPSWTWASIGRLEATMQSFRAVEQGLTLFRCGSWAPSTVYDAYHQLYGYKPLLGRGNFTVDIPLRKHVWTLYSATGQAFSYICCAFAIVILALVVLPERLVRKALGAIEDRVPFAVGRTYGRPLKGATGATSSDSSSAPPQQEVA
ncbi:hypothetical protein BGW41_008019 [Actinomortierella wolfii]|nr:hypothetical protein BGW41_008019 [Actinomortierella wolfii]